VKAAMAKQHEYTTNDLIIIKIRPVWGNY